MYRLAAPPVADLPDVHAFVALLNRLAEHPEPTARQLFTPGGDLIVSRAPGRLDVMGGIADYSGALVLQLPTREATLVALQLSDDKDLRIVSLGVHDSLQSPAFHLPLATLLHEGQPITYEFAREHFKEHAKRHWAAYAIGTLLVLMRERGVRFTRGMRLLVDSSLPEGKGVASSAAFEVAVMQAVAAAAGITLPGRDLALLCQKVENLVVGAPCGVMDQMTSACGENNQLLALLCQPAELLGHVSLPPELAVWGLDSGVRHSVSGADYGSVRVGAFMGYRIIADLAGLPVTTGQPAQPVAVQDARWGGCLANLTPSVFEQFYAAQLPARIKGADFLARYGGTTDAITRVDAQREYAVRAPTAHPVAEHFRVRSYAEMLRPGVDLKSMALLGELMYQSHASYSACGLGCPGTDLLVELVRAAGPAAGLYGAKITGGGSGGTVAVLGLRGADAAVRAVAQQYHAKTGYAPYLFAGSSPGAVAFGVLRLHAVAE